MRVRAPTDTELSLLPYTRLREADEGMLRAERGDDPSPSVRFAPSAILAWEQRS